MAGGSICRLQTNALNCFCFVSRFFFCCFVVGEGDEGVFLYSEYFKNALNPFHISFESLCTEVCKM